MNLHRPTRPIKTIFLLLVFLVYSPLIVAQPQPDIPMPRGPVDLSETSNIIIFIVLPLVVIIFFFIWRGAMKKRRKEQEEQEKKRNQHKDNQ